MKVTLSLSVSLRLLFITACIALICSFSVGGARHIINLVWFCCFTRLTISLVQSSAISVAFLLRSRASLLITCKPIQSGLSFNLVMVCFASYIVSASSIVVWHWGCSPQGHMFDRKWFPTRVTLCLSYPTLSLFILLLLLCNEFCWYF